MQNLDFYDLKPKLSDFRQEVLVGLSKPQKSIPPKFFYDKQGSEIFEQICELEEYYPTRTELAIFKQHCEEIAALMGENCLIVEYGSGSSEKIRIFLDVLKNPSAYMPIDISKEHMLRASEEVARAYPKLDVLSVCGDYTQKLILPVYEKKPVKTKVIFFPGNTIGNLDYADAVELFSQAATLVGSGGGMLIGIDMKKDPQILHAAYNDAKGVTAAFNLNLLVRMNRDLSANFDLSSFSHYAFYSPQGSRIEMHLVSLKNQVVSVAKQEFDFSKGESIHTENSYKFNLEEFQELAEEGGFNLVKVWSDDNQFFSICYLSVA